MRRLNALLAALALSVALPFAAIGDEGVEEEEVVVVEETEPPAVGADAPEDVGVGDEQPAEENDE
jgi:hypothetical protein